MKGKKILYIGNFLSTKTNYKTVAETLSVLMEKERAEVYCYSDKANKIIRFLHMCFAVIKYRKSVDYILIDTYSTLNFIFAVATSQLARFYRLKYIPILHGGNLPSRLKKSPKLSKMIFKNAYKNIAPSNYLKTAFEKEGFNVDFIPNVLEIKKYKFNKRTQIEPKILWVRSLKSIYNPLMAIDVFKLLKEKFSNAKLCMIGPISDKKTYEEVLKKVTEHNLNSDIELTGALSKEEWHKKSEEFDIFINTTNFDNTPVSVMEAMALGLTVISTNVGGIPYLIEDKVDGVLVDKQNTQLMFTEIVDLISTNNQTLAKNARNKVENFSWGIVKNQWNKILN